MKKVIFTLVLLALFLTGCGDRSSSDDTDGIVVIRETMFITQINDINLNSRDYLGKTIKLEGFIKRNHWNDHDYFFVIRNGPGCCGDDGEIGFEISWDPDYSGSGNHMDQRNSFPAPNDWVEAIGELKSYSFLGYPHLFLVLSELNVLEKRGIEFVMR